LVVASTLAPASAHADGYRYGAPYPYYSKKELKALERADRNLRRAYERADRAARRQQEREAREYRKLMRAQDRYYSRYGYPYASGYEYGPAPYGLTFRYDRDG
jgi:hypothetical protein